MDNDYSWTTTPAEQRLRALEMAVALETTKGAVCGGTYTYRGIVEAAEKFLEFLEPPQPDTEDPTSEDPTD